MLIEYKYKIAIINISPYSYSKNRLHVLTFLFCILYHIDYAMPF